MKISDGDNQNDNYDYDWTKRIKMQILLFLQLKQMLICILKKKIQLYVFLFFSNRFGSSSSQASQSSGDICRICHCESDPQNPLLTPCYCSGSLKYVHQACLQQWLTASETNSCELCKFPFIMHTKIKPFNEVRLILCTKKTHPVNKTI